MKRISISVIVPVYNVELYLRDCLDSLVTQTQPFYEIILVNDGSTDHSRQICEEYCVKCRNIMLLQQDNQGLSSARNLGLKYASGDYIVFVDSDDYVTKDMNESLRKILLDNDLDILYYNADVVDELQGTYTEQLIRSDFLNNCIMSGIKFLKECFPDNYRCSVCLAAYRKNFLDEYGIVFPCGLYYEDNIFFIQTVLKAKTILCIPCCFYNRRIRKGSIMTGEMSIKKCLDHIAINLLIWEELYQYEYKNTHINFIRKYISIRMIETFILIKGFEQDKEVSKAMLSMMETFMEKWFPIYSLTQLNWEDMYSLRCVSNFLVNLKRNFGEVMQLKCELLDDIVDTMVEEKLRMLPLQEAHSQVGIYGIGLHTQCMIKLYQRYVGPINCRLFFIVSEKKQDSFLNKRVINCEEIPENAKIIISSQIFQHEMLHTLLGKGIIEEKIIILYDAMSNYRCDMIMFAEVDEEHFKR